MSFYIVKGDLLKQNTEAIVISGAPNMRLEGPIGSRIKEKCGDKLIKELKQVTSPAITDCRIVNSYNLPSNRIIYVFAPRWNGGKNNEDEDLRSSYINCLDTAMDFGIESVSFPLLSVGGNDFPKKRAILIATKTISEYVEDNDIDVALVVYSKSIWKEYKAIFTQYPVIDGELNSEDYIKQAYGPYMQERFGWYTPGTEKILDESKKRKKVSEMLEYFMKRQCLSPVECYTGVISKGMFYKYLNGTQRPNKNTLLSLGINMGLYINDINELLSPLSEFLNPANPRDRLIMLLLDHGKEFDEINQVLANETGFPLKTTK